MCRKRKYYDAMKRMTNKYYTVTLWLWIHYLIARCDADWVRRPENNHVYYFLDVDGNKADKKHDTAQDQCVSLGANLVTVNSHSENQFLQDNLVLSRNHWIGLYCSLSCTHVNQLQWYGENAGYRNWEDGETPDLTPFTAMNVFTFMRQTTGEWDYVTASNNNNKRPYICEKNDGCHDPSNPCQYDGTCNADNSGGYTCTCQPGVTGNNCETNFNDCQSHDCVHGSCVDGYDSYTCSCHSGFTGERCETDIDECTDGTHGCNTNNSQCVNMPGSYSCNCNAGYTGRTCWNDINECHADPCMYGGTCSNTPGSYSCSCTARYTGMHCQTDIDECTTGNHNCNTNNGQCDNTEGGFECDCQPGWQGATCSGDINECHRDRDPCQNGGSCDNTMGSYSCSCTARYEGMNCEFDIDECAADNFCNHGTCDNGDGTFLCICNRGYTGGRCNTDIDECSLTIRFCENGATCHDTDGSYMCACAPGYTGQNCSTDINECESNPCLNGGTCNDHVNYYECVCPRTYTGENCSTDVDECEEPGYCGVGTCINTDGGYNCECPTGYDGMYCDQDINECQDEENLACHNHGTCTNTNGNFNCECDEGYTSDDNCAKQIKPTPKPTKRPTEEDLTPYRNALTAAAIIASITFVLFMLLLIEDRVYYYRLKKHNSDTDWVTTDERSLPSTSANTMETSVDASDAGQRNDQFVNIYTENNNENNSSHVEAGGATNSA